MDTTQREPCPAACCCVHGAELERPAGLLICNVASSSEPGSAWCTCIARIMHSCRGSSWAFHSPVTLTARRQGDLIVLYNTQLHVLPAGEQH